RVLTLVNLFRLLVPLLLAVLYLTVTPPRVGQVDGTLFVGVATVYFVFGMASLAAIRQRWPAIEMQTVIGVCVDVLVISLLAYASGGMRSGLAALLVLPIAAASIVVRQRLALMFAA